MRAKLRHQLMHAKHGHTVVTITKYVQSFNHDACVALHIYGSIQIIGNRDTTIECEYSAGLAFILKCYRHWNSKCHLVIVV